MDSLNSYVRAVNMDTSTYTDVQTPRDRIYNIASYFDSLLALVAKPTLEAYRKNDKETARTLPEYVELETSQGQEVGRSFDISMDMMRLEHSVAYHPPLRKIMQSLNNSPFTRLVGTVDTFLQRGQKGWSHSDMFSMDTYMAGMIGSQLLYLAENTHGWPGGDEYPEFTDWQTALQENGQKLLRYAGRDMNPIENVSPTEWMEIEETRYQEAKTALEWVAKNLPALWD